jgi:hypothetical protein
MVLQELLVLQEHAVILGLMVQRELRDPWEIPDLLGLMVAQVL